MKHAAAMPSFLLYLRGGRREERLFSVYAFKKYWCILEMSSCKSDGSVLYYKGSLVRSENVEKGEGAADEQRSAIG